MNTINIQAHLFLFLKELLKLKDNILEAWCWIFSLLQITLTSPLVQYHFHFLLVHSNWVGITDDILFKKIKEFLIRKVSKLNMNVLFFIGSLIPHLLPQLCLLHQSCLSIFNWQSLHELVTGKHVSCNSFFQVFVIG